MAKSILPSFTSSDEVKKLIGANKYHLIKFSCLENLRFNLVDHQLDVIALLWYFENMLVSISQTNPLRSRFFLNNALMGKIDKNSDDDDGLGVITDNSRDSGELNVNQIVRETNNFNVKFNMFVLFLRPGGGKTHAIMGLTTLNNGIPLQLNVKDWLKNFGQIATDYSNSFQKIKSNCFLIPVNVIVCHSEEVCTHWLKSYKEFVKKENIFYFDKSLSFQQFVSRIIDVLNSRKKFALKITRIKEWLQTLENILNNLLSNVKLFFRNNNFNGYISAQDNEVSLRYICNESEQVKINVNDLINYQSSTSYRDDNIPLDVLLNIKEFKASSDIQEMRKKNLMNKVSHLVDNGLFYDSFLIDTTSTLRQVEEVLCLVTAILHLVDINLASAENDMLNLTINGRNIIGSVVVVPNKIFSTRQENALILFSQLKFARVIYDHFDMRTQLYCPLLDSLSTILPTGTLDMYLSYFETASLFKKMRPESVGRSLSLMIRHIETISFKEQIMSPIIYVPDEYVKKCFLETNVFDFYRLCSTVKRAEIVLGGEGKADKWFGLDMFLKKVINDRLNNTVAIFLPLRTALETRSYFRKIAINNNIKIIDRTHSAYVRCCDRKDCRKCKRYQEFWTEHENNEVATQNASPVVLVLYLLESAVGVDLFFFNKIIYFDNESTLSRVIKTVPLQDWASKAALLLRRMRRPIYKHMNQDGGCEIIMADITFKGPENKFKLESYQTDEILQREDTLISTFLNNI